MKKNKHTTPLIMDKFIISIIVITILIFIGAILLGSKIAPSVEIVPDKNTKAQVEKTTHDWGEIKMGDGNVEAEFSIKNDGTQPLKLYNIKTSCMCTTAQLVYDNKTSPTFGMHGKSNYVLNLPKGKKAQLKVIYDPAYHGPSGVGPITRQVDIDTNDPENPSLSFVLTAAVTR